MLSEVSCCDPAQISPFISYGQIWLLSILQLMFCSITFPTFQLGSVSLHWWQLFIAVALPHILVLQGPAALSQYSASIPTHGNWANPSELWGSHWLFTCSLNSAGTSVYIPLLKVSWEQKCIPNFLCSNFACSILMWFSVTLHCVHWDSQLLLPELWFSFAPWIMILFHFSFHFIQCISGCCCQLATVCSWCLHNKPPSSTLINSYFQW